MDICACACVRARARARRVCICVPSPLVIFFCKSPDYPTGRGRQEREREKTPSRPLRRPSPSFSVYQTDTREIFSRHWHRASDSPSIREEARSPRGFQNDVRCTLGILDSLGKRMRSSKAHSGSLEGNIAGATVFRVIVTEQSRVDLLSSP